MIRSVSSGKRAITGVEQGRLPRWTRGLIAVLSISSWLVAGSVTVAADPTPPDYEQCRLESIFPLGGQAGTSVTVTFQGAKGGLAHPREILVDGPPGITVDEVKAVDPNQVTARLTIAADAASGRRGLRVVSEQSGLTNQAWFVVGHIAEATETESNNTAATAEPITLPVTVNGRIASAGDVDWYRFSGRKGAHCVVSVQSAVFDAHGQYQFYGYVDATVALFDAAGRTLAEAQDSIGLDPLLEHDLPANGEYLVRVHLLNHVGFPQAGYRCTIGELPIATSLFPAGGRRGSLVVLEAAGPGVSSGLKLSRELPTQPGPIMWFGPRVDEPLAAIGWDLPLVLGDFPEAIEQEPNDGASQATPLAIPQTMNGRFLEPGDRDLYRFEVDSTQPVWIETVAQRWLKAPVDSVVEVLDAEGRVVQSTDDGVPLAGYESFHDFRTPDTRLIFTPPIAGTYLLRLTENSGANGPRCVYRLTIKPALPDFEVVLFPDAVPVWGPGSTSAVLVKLERQAGLAADVELSIRGLPEGWTGSRHVNPGEPVQRGSYYSEKQFLTITAPPTAQPGTAVPFEVVGRARVGERDIERVAIPLTLYYTSDTGFFRATRTARAAVTRPHAVRLEADTTPLVVRQGETVTVPVRVISAEPQERISLTPNLATNGVACSLGAPQQLPIRDGKAELPLSVSAEVPPGLYPLTIALSWRSDIRIGMPGPCTPLRLLQVLPKP